MPVHQFFKRLGQGPFTVGQLKSNSRWWQKLVADRTDEWRQMRANAKDGTAESKLKEVETTLKENDENERVDKRKAAEEKAAEIFRRKAAKRTVEFSRWRVVLGNSRGCRCDGVDNTPSRCGATATFLGLGGPRASTVARREHACILIGAFDGWSLCCEKCVITRTMIRARKSNGPIPG